MSTRAGAEDDVVYFAKPCTALATPPPVVVVFALTTTSTRSWTRRKYREQQRPTLARTLPQHLAQGACSGFHLSGQRNQAARTDRIVPSVRVATAQYGDADGLQTRDLHHSAGSRSAFFYGRAR